MLIRGTVLVPTFNLAEGANAQCLPEDVMADLDEGGLLARVGGRGS